MCLTRRPLNLLKVYIFVLIQQTVGYQVYDDYNSEGWIPISTAKLSSYIEFKPFSYKDGRSHEANYFKDKSLISTNEKLIANDLKTVKQNNLPNIKELNNTNNINGNSPTLKDKAFILYDENVKNIVKKIVKMNSVLPATPVIIYDSEKYVDVTAKSASTTSTHNAVQPTLRPKVAYDIPFIPYSHHATNKSDATAYYPRPNDYYGTRARRLRLSSHNENMEPNSEEFKSKYLNSGSTIFKEMEKIRKENAMNDLEIVEPRFDEGKEKEYNERNDGYLKNKSNSSQIFSRKNNADVYSKEKKIEINKDKDTVETKTNNYLSILNSNIEYPKYNTLNTANVEDLNLRFREILEKYNIKEGDKLINYELSKAALNRKQEIGGYAYRNSMVNRLMGYNSLNHLPIDPVTAVWLSHYGQYFPGYNGRNINYRNLYGYLASNNIHNNKPFGSYKIYSDTDV